MVVKLYLSTSQWLVVLNVWEKCGNEGVSVCMCTCEYISTYVESTK